MVRIRLLGPFEVSAGGRPVAITSERLRSLLAVLAVSAPEPLPAEVIGQRIWGGAQPTHVRRSVQTLVARLRRVLGDHLVVSEPGGYRLLTDPDLVDVLRFRRLLEEAAGAANEVLERELLEEALALWRGAPFEGIRADWLLQTAAHPLEERYLTAVERRIDLDMTADRQRTLVAELRELTVRYPLRESLWTRLLLVLDLSGRPAEALAAYDAIRNRLVAELGVDPGPELREIHARLLAADAGRTPSLPPVPVPRQLPSDIPHFTGRSAALAALDALLVAAGPVVATIDGAGGIGKTALAVHWAHRVRDHFGDGQLYVNLRGYGPGDPVGPAAALDSLLRSLGVPSERIPAGIEARARLFGSRLAERRVLLVLDNALDADQVAPLLPGGSHCLTVITSRTNLRGLVARRIDLDELTPDDAVALLLNVLPRSDAWPKLLAGLGELARLCGYLPLALVIAAERAGREPGSRLHDLVLEIRAERHRLDAFESEDDPAISVRAVFSWSYRALDAETARLFRLLALQPGPDIGAPAIAALAGISEPAARRLLARLIDRHLVEERRPGRYELHDLLRSYAAELVERVDAATERIEALERMLGFYVHTANNARAAVDPGRGLMEIGKPPAAVQLVEFAGDTEALAWFDTERITLAAAVLHAADLGRDRAAARLTQMLWNLLFARRDLDSWSGVQRVAVHAARQTGDPALEAALTNQLAITQMELDQNDLATRYFEQALRLFRRSGDLRGQAMVRTNLGLVLRRLGRFEESRICLESSVRYYADAQPTVTGPLNNLALTYVEMGRHDDAVAAARKAVDIDRAVGGRFQLGTPLETLGQAYAAQRKNQDAIAAFEEALEIRREFGDRWTQAITLVNLGKVLLATGDDARAAASWRHALALINEMGGADTGELHRADVVQLLAGVEATSSAG